MGDRWLTSLVWMRRSERAGRLHWWGVAGTASHHSRCESVRASSAWTQPPPLLVPLITQVTTRSSNNDNLHEV